MKFEELNNTIPYAMGGKVKTLTMEPYPNVKLLLPGRHAKDTTPKGGDFCVVINDRVFREDHQFKHNDIFDDVEEKRAALDDIDGFMRAYFDIVQGNADPVDIKSPKLPGIDPATFLYAVQCLAVAEHRRYAVHELKYGGRYLPLRFAAGISEGLWSAEEASWLERKGRPGVEQLERERGVPQLTQELFDAND